MIESISGKLNKSNVARLRLWKGRELDEVPSKNGVMEEITENDISREPTIPRKGRGRPRKVVITKPQMCSGKAKKVSPSVVPRKKKGLILTKLTPNKILDRNRLNTNEVKPLRRSPRLLIRTAVT